MQSTESLVQNIGNDKLPPVDQWNPDYCGEMDLVLKADGSWIYLGTPFTRRPMQLLFSKVIKKEQEKYFLVTPVEKLGIQVEWQPFVIVDFEVIESENGDLYRFTDNCDNQRELRQPRHLDFSCYQDQQLPIINIRRNLFASFSRSCYYNLLERADVIEEDDKTIFQIRSNGHCFNIGLVDKQDR